VLVSQLGELVGEAHLGLGGGRCGGRRNVCGGAHGRGFRLLAMIEEDQHQGETYRLLFEQRPLCL
jgi:hypothetical protein